MDIHFEVNGESFVWDKHKAESNVRKHGIRFEEAAWVSWTLYWSSRMRLATMNHGMP
jgi:uncharacterized DUF497 family protein